MDDSGRPCITEYSLAKVFGHKSSAEFRRCMRWADPHLTWWSQREGDVFSFAMIMLEAFTGQAPFFPKPDSVAFLALERRERPERPTHVDLTAKLWALVERCWDDDKENRPKMAEVLRILRDWSVLLFLAASHSLENPHQPQ
ncbi:hypothetical protein BJ322DRAFT_1026733 [Thelephora terrestris]|uniref:Protein kinase domain-containing protein n=1 Tax=Thelephora terrestris TaxID=56493 RepID=A0A9P6LC80_9AGAM|nr:hypothetical protein BJ322DRAFT_1026733 [Thelephora terrestris]